MFKGKKGSAESAWKMSLYLLIIIIYFIFFIMIVSYSSELTPDIKDIEDNYSVSYCSNPRYKYDPTTLESVEMRMSELATIDCSESIGVKSKNICESIEGCSWSNISLNKGWWNIFCKLYSGACSGSIQSCNGTIDTDSYGISSTDGLIDEYSTNISSIYIDIFKAIDIAQVTRDVSPCLHPVIMPDQHACYLFGCTWNIDAYSINNSYQIKYSQNGTIEAFKVIGTLDNGKVGFRRISHIGVGLFFYQYDFGMGSSINFILYIIFIFIPSVIGLICSIGIILSLLPTY